LLNGGYFVDPRLSGNLVFPYEEFIRFNDIYVWVGREAGTPLTPEYNDEWGIVKTEGETEKIHLGAFSDISNLKYVDHYNNFDGPDDINNTNIDIEINTSISSPESNKINYNYVIYDFFGTTIDEQIKYTETDRIDNRGEGYLYYKKPGSKPQRYECGNKIINYQIIDNNIIIELDNDDETSIRFIEESIQDDIKFIENTEHIDINKNNLYKILYNESKNIILIAELALISDPANNNKQLLNLTLYPYNIDTKKLEKIFTGTLKLDDVHASQTLSIKPDNFVFTYNNELDLYMIAYLYNLYSSDENGDKTLLGPAIYQHKFKLYENTDKNIDKNPINFETEIFSAQEKEKEENN
jgi:hypothetical protein